MHKTSFNLIVETSFTKNKLARTRKRPISMNLEEIIERTQMLGRSNYALIDDGKFCLWCQVFTSRA